MNGQEMAGAPDPGQEMAGAPSPEQVMGSMEDERMAQLEAVAASAPTAEKPIDSKLIKKLVDAMNSLVDKIDPEMADVEFAGEGKISGQFPAEVFVPLVLIMSFVGQLGEDFSKYMMQPEDLINDAAIRKATALIKKMSGDKELMERMKAPLEAEEEMPEEENADMEAVAVQPDQMDEDDQAMMEMM
tara:strand:+ start:822 stop:1382 length:561 start_codon:yes stop_codon:yes gene_type:complete